MKKGKMKSKGKKLYRSTNGRMQRVVRNYRIRRLAKRRKVLKKLKAQLSK